MEEREKVKFYAAAGTDDWILDYGNWFRIRLQSVQKKENSVNFL
jgi:hypothetical protein